ncbi:MAG: Excinuclease ABC subunit A paralog of unknown function, partial [uncultured Nocardioidaceae bacterium]
DHGHDHGQVDARPAGCRHPRPHPRAGRTGEQPQGHQRRAPEAPVDGLHRRLRVGQELAGLRHDRRGVAADDQRDLQRLPAGLHAHPRAPGRRPARGADDRDHRRPGADGCEPALDRGHRHRRQRHAADPVQPRRSAPHRPADGVRLQRPDPHRQRRDEDREGRQGGEDRRQGRRLPGRHVPPVRGHGGDQRLRPDRDLRRVEVARGRRPARAGLQHGRLVRPDLQRRRPPDGQADRGLHRQGARAAPAWWADQDQGRGSEPHLRGRAHQGPEVDAVKGPRGDAAARAPVRRAGGDLHDLPRVRRHPAEPGGALLPDRGEEHRRPVPDADQRPRRVAARPRRAVRGAAAHGVAAPARRVRRDRPRLPVAGAAGRDAVGRGGAAHQDDPSPGVLAHRRHLRLRRADDRPAPARHRADEPAPAAAARQGQHDARRRAQAGDDRHRRPRRRPRSGRRYGGRQHLLRGHGGGPAGQRHPHRPAPRRPGCAEGDLPVLLRGARGPRGHLAQPAGRRRRHPARCAVCAHRCRRLGQELAGAQLGRGARGCGGGRPDRDPGVAAEQPGDVHRAAGTDPQGVRQGERREARAVQLELRGSLPGLQRRRCHLHRARRDGDGGVHLRGVRGQAVPGGGAGVHARRAQHRRRAGDAGQGGRGVLRPRGAGARGAQDPRAAGRCRARLREPGPAPDHAVRRRAAAPEAGHPDGRGRRRLRPRRADHRPPPRRRRAAAGAPGPARRLREVGDRDRAPPGGHGPRRLDHRPRPGCRPRRRPDRLRGHPRRPRRRPLDAHRRAPGGVRRRL